MAALDAADGADAEEGKMSLQQVNSQEASQFVEANMGNDKGEGLAKDESAIEPPSPAE